MNLYPEIEVTKNGLIKRYKLIYGAPDSQEGYFYFWPKNEDDDGFTKLDWLRAYTTDNLSIKLYLIGSIYRHREEIDMIGSEMQYIIQNNENLFLYLLNKYFDDYEDGLLIKQDTVFFDLLYGPYAPYRGDDNIKEVKIHSNSEEEEEYNENYIKLFSDGTLIKILDHEYTWDLLDNDTFIEADFFDELVQDLNAFEQLLH